MIEKYDTATEPGAKGALLRGEGLYDSHISYWRKARDSGALKSSAAAVPADGVLVAAHKGRPACEAENERLRKRLAKAEVKLEQTRAALDIMGKAFALLELRPAFILHVYYHSKPSSTLLRLRIPACDARQRRRAGTVQVLSVRPRTVSLGNLSYPVFCTS